MNPGRRSTFPVLLAIASSVALSACGFVRAAERNVSSNAAPDLAGKLDTLEERSYAAWKSGDTKFWTAFLSDKFAGWGRSGRKKSSR